MTPGWSLALVHDYLTQRGGAERVVLALADAYPDAPVLTSLYDPAGTFPDFAGHDVRTLPLDRIPGLRAHHRLALPLLAPAFSRLQVDAEVAVCSSSGWAHGARVTGRKLVYCHTPARWLYQRDRYLSGARPSARAAQWLLAPPLRRWDRRAAASAHRYLVNSNEVRRRVAELYGIDAEVVPPPVDIDPQAPSEPIDGHRARLPPLRVAAAPLQERRGGVPRPSPASPTGGWSWWAPAPWPTRWRPPPRPT